MSDTELERLLKSQGEESRRRHPLLHRVTSILVVFVMLGTIVGGLVYLTLRFPWMRTRSLSFEVLGWVIAVIGTIFCILVMTLACKLERWLDRRAERSKWRK